MTKENNVLGFLIIIVVSFGFMFYNIFHLLSQIKVVEEQSMNWKQNYEQCISKEAFNQSKQEVIVQNIQNLRPRLDKSVVNDYANLIQKYCPEGVQTHMVAIIEQESGYNPGAKNHNDYGLGQINYSTWKKFFEIKNPRVLLDSATNIRLSCKILHMAYVSHSDHPKWYAFYHSWNSVPQKIYIKKIDKILKGLKNE